MESCEEAKSYYLAVSLRVIFTLLGSSHGFSLLQPTTINLISLSSMRIVTSSGHPANQSSSANKGHATRNSVGFPDALRGALQRETELFCHWSCPPGFAEVAEEWMLIRKQGTAASSLSSQRCPFGKGVVGVRAHPTFQSRKPRCLGSS